MTICRKALIAIPRIMNNNFNLIAENPQSTVAAEYTPDNKRVAHYQSELANPNQGIEEKTITIQEDYIKNLMRDDGNVKNVYLIKKDNIHVS